MVHRMIQLVHRLGWAGLASPEVWQHLLAEMPQHARLLGIHDEREVQSVSKTWTSLTARVKKTETEESVTVTDTCSYDWHLATIHQCLSHTVTVPDLHNWLGNSLSTTTNVSNL